MKKRNPKRPFCAVRRCFDRKTIRVGLLSVCAAHAAVIGIPLHVIELTFKGAQVQMGAAVEAPDPASTGGLEP